MPFAGLRQDIVAELVKCGEHPPVPHHAPDGVRRLMLGGWVKSVSDRMGTDEMLELLEEEIKKTGIIITEEEQRADDVPVPACATRSTLRRQQQEAAATNTRQ